MEANAIAGVNLNDPWVLSVYTRLFAFKGDSTQSLCTFQRLSPAQQRDLQGIAHHFNLEYEYTRADRTARIGRPTSSGQEDPISGARVIPVSAGFQNHTQNSSSDHLQAHESTQKQSEHPSGHNARVAYEFGSDIHSVCDPNDLPTAASSSKERTSAGTRYIQPSTDSLQSIPDVSSPLGSQFATYRTSSRASSTSSLHSGQGRSRFRKMFSRRSSLHSRPSFQSQTSLQSRASSGYEEIVFEVESGRPPSLSVSSRQRASMDNVKKAAMLAVKKVGACWRCKILRKTCDPESPCQNCPKTKHQSDWHSVGCKRGSVVDKVARTLLCPNSDKPSQRSNSPERRREGKEVKRKNKEVRRITEERNNYVNDQPTSNIFRSWFLERSRLQDDLQFDGDMVIPDSTQLQPLVQCALAIEWEIKQLNSSDGQHKDVWRQFIHEIYPWFTQFESLLHSATEYQSYTEQNQLIAQSLICVRNSLEVFRAQYCSTSTGDAHTRCSLTSGCKIECITELDASLTSYLKELGRVLFKKENMRSTDCWLSLFYSLCLQGYVRRILCRTSVDDKRSFPRDYLHLVVRLFSARFGTYDPLAASLSYPKSGKDASSNKDYFAAQLAVNRSTWNARSISNPCEYLKGLCGATEAALVDDIKATKPSERAAPDVSQDPITLQASLESIAKIELTDFTFDDHLMWSGDDLLDPVHDTTSYGNDWVCDMETFDFNMTQEVIPNCLSPSLPTDADLNTKDTSLRPYEYSTCSPEDVFTPQWVRGHGVKQQGWCGLCDPGQWLLISDSSYMQDKAFKHGINPATGRQFEEPKSTRQSSCDTWEAYCGICLQWIPLYWDKDNSYFWNEHAFRCHTNSGALQGTNLGLDRAERATQADNANDFEFAII